MRPVRPGYPFYPNRNKISPYAGRRECESARARSPQHNCTGGNKQTRLSPVHTVTLAGFRLRRRRYKGFAKLHVAEPRRNFDLMRHERGESARRAMTPRTLRSRSSVKFVIGNVTPEVNTRMVPSSFFFCNWQLIFRVLYFRKFTRKLRRYFEICSRIICDNTLSQQCVFASAQTFEWTSKNPKFVVYIPLFRVIDFDITFVMWCNN